MLKETSVAVPEGLMGDAVSNSSGSEVTHLRVTCILDRHLFVRCLSLTALRRGSPSKTEQNTWIDSLSGLVGWLNLKQRATSSTVDRTSWLPASQVSSLELRENVSTQIRNKFEPAPCEPQGNKRRAL